MATLAAILTLLMVLAYPTHSFRIAFHNSPITGAALEFKQFSDQTSGCFTIPRSKATGEQKVDDIVVQAESKSPILLAFYAIPNNPSDIPCAKQNLQIAALFHKNTSPDVEQFFTPIWPGLLHWRKIPQNSEDWLKINQPMVRPGDVINRSGSGWLIEQNEIGARQSTQNSDQITDIQPPQDPVPQQDMNLPTMASIDNQGQPNDLLQQQDIRPKSKVLDPKALKDQIFQLAAQYKIQALKANPDLKIDLRDLEPAIPELTSLMQFKDDQYLEQLGPQGFTDYVRETARTQHAISDKGGYLPVPLGLRHRFGGKKLNRLGFNVLPKEELKSELARQRNPYSYFRRFAGMGRKNLLGHYMPLTSEWEEIGGLMSLNQEVQSPRRIKIIDDGGDENIVGDFTDLNGELQKVLTEEELRMSLENTEKSNTAPTGKLPGNLKL
ncbi:hypothetical protein TWF718_005947 [Orbilia javanica]|uniref:Uncharacterized protein n=1 Tax=Orbilia javanica TaxID=47235 RepID=A0AAN8N4B9_9PEZI